MNVMESFVSCKDKIDLVNTFILLLNNNLVFLPWILVDLNMLCDDQTGTSRLTVTSVTLINDHRLVICKALLRIPRHFP